jgi:hypothetical protein
MVNRSRDICDIVTPKYSYKKILVSFVLVLCFSACIVSAADNKESDTKKIDFDLNVSDTIVQIGDTIKIDGNIDPSWLKSPQDKVLLHVTSPHESAADAFYQLNVNRTSGNFKTDLPADAIGDWSFVARYQDYSSGDVPVKVTSRARLKESQINLIPPSGRVFKGDQVEMGGYLVDEDGIGLAHKQIWYAYGLPSYSCEICDEDDIRVWQNDLGPSSTDETGYFRMRFYASDSGEFAVKASFNGDMIYDSSESEIKHIRVF